MYLLHFLSIPHSLPPTSTGNHSDILKSIFYGERALLVPLSSALGMVALCFSHASTSRSSLCRHLLCLFEVIMYPPCPGRDLDSCEFGARSLQLLVLALQVTVSPTILYSISCVPASSHSRLLLAHTASSCKLGKGAPDSQTEPCMEGVQPGEWGTSYLPPPPHHNLHKLRRLSFPNSFQTSFVPLEKPSSRTPSEDYPKARFPFSPFNKVTMWLNLRGSFCSHFIGPQEILALLITLSLK